MKKLSDFLLVLLIILILGCAGSVHVENDIFNPFHHNDDKYFTHGTRFNYFKEKENERKTYSLGQNIYTPSTKKKDADRAILERDRPYTGWLYTSYRSESYNVGTDVRDIWGLSVGCTGRCSMAKEAQQGIHNLLGQNVPEWQKEFTLKSEPGFILEKERYYGLYNSNLVRSDLYGLLKAGSIVDNASLGTNVYFGYNIPTFTSEPIIFKKSVEAPLWSYYIFGRAEERLVLYNHLLEGSLIQDERHTVDPELFVQEFDLGATIGYQVFKFTYRYTLFSAEWEEKKGSFGFGGIDITW